MYLYVLIVFGDVHVDIRIRCVLMDIYVYIYIFAHCVCMCTCIRCVYTYTCVHSEGHSLGLRPKKRDLVKQAWIVAVLQLVEDDGSEPQRYRAWMGGGL